MINGLSENAREIIEYFNTDRDVLTKPGVVKTLYLSIIPGRAHCDAKGRLLPSTIWGDMVKGINSWYASIVWVKRHE